MERKGKYNKALRSKNYFDFDTYITKERWSSFYNQIYEILALEPDSLLEIGPGNNYLKNMLLSEGIKYKSCDVDPDVDPDFVSDIRCLSDVIKVKFDVVVAFQVLEHLPYKYFKSNLKQLSKRSSKYVIISVPVNGISYDFKMALSKKIKIRFYGKLPLIRTSLSKEHFWEIRNPVPLKKIMSDIKEQFKILKHYQCEDNVYHYFFVLEKK